MYILKSISLLYEKLNIYYFLSYLLITRHLTCKINDLPLSYSPIFALPLGLEPRTHALTVRCSNQLS